MRRSLLAVVLAVFSFAMASAKAQVLYNVDINDAGNTFGTYTGTGVLLGGTFWNGVSGSGSQSVSLQDASNGASSVTLVTSGNTFADGRSSTNALLADYAYPDPLVAPAVFSLTGLTASGTYNLVLYGAYPTAQGFSTSFTVIGATSTNIVLTLDAQNTNFVDGTSGSPGTYVQLNNIVATSGGALTINFEGAPGSTGQVGIMSGFQVQAVPEPSTWSMLAVSGIMVVGIVWHRRLHASS